jgi:hypothetical protein
MSTYDPWIRVVPATESFLFPPQTHISFLPLLKFLSRKANAPSWLREFWTRTESRSLSPSPNRSSSLPSYRFLDRREVGVQSHWRSCSVCYSAVSSYLFIILVSLGSVCWYFLDASTFSYIFFRNRNLFLIVLPYKPKSVEGTQYADQYSSAYCTRSTDLSSLAYEYSYRSQTLDSYWEALWVWDVSTDCLLDGVPALQSARYPIVQRERWQLKLEVGIQFELLYQTWQSKFSRLAFSLPRQLWHRIYNLGYKRGRHCFQVRDSLFDECIQ